MLEQKGTNKKSHRAGAWRRIDHALVDHAPVARANFAIWPRKKTGQFRSPPHILQTFQSGGRALVLNGLRSKIALD